MCLLFICLLQKKVPQVPLLRIGGGWGGVVGVVGFIYCVWKKEGKKERKKKGGGRGKKIIPKYNKRRTVSADFHLHKFSYILVKIIAEPSTAPAQSRQREENLREHRVVGKRHTDNRFQAAREQRWSLFITPHLTHTTPPNTHSHTPTPTITGTSSTFLGHEVSQQSSITFAYLFICLFIFCARGMFWSLSPSCSSSSRSWLALFPPPPPPPCLSFKRHFSLHSYPPPLLLLLRLLVFGFLSPECIKINMLAAVCAPAIPSLSFRSFSLFF